MAIAAEPQSWTHYRARVAALSRDRSPDDPDLIAARRNLRVERLAEHIEKVVAQAPPPDAAQVNRLVALLTPASGGPGAA